MTPSNQTVDVSVIIVNWNTRQLLENCLDSLPASCASHRYEIIVVDNNSTDGSQEMIRQKFPAVKLICNSSNAGFARANNQGIRASNGRYVSLVNSDVKVLPGCHDQLVEFMDAMPQAGIAGPRVLNGDLTMQSSCRRFPGLWNNICDAFAFRRFFPDSAFFAGEHMLYFKHDRMIFPDVLVGCFLFARRQAIDEFGFLDENFFMYGEDVDWCLRCWKSGWKIAFYPGAEAIHYRGGSSNADPVRFAVVLQRARQQFWKKHYSGLKCFSLACLLAVENTLRWMMNAASVILKIKSRTDAIRRMKCYSACVKALFSRYEPTAS
jgi:GT2 family glycosyltransferase